MTGVFPNSGVSASEASNTIANPDLVAGCIALWASTNRCQPRFDPAAFNAVVSEILNFINCGTTQYDCNRLDNMCVAINAMLAGKVDKTELYGCLLDTFPTAAGACSIESLVMTTNAAGCREIARYSEASARLGFATQASVYGPTFGPTHRPINPADPNTYYNEQMLATDVNSAPNNANVDYSRLLQNRLEVLNITVPCDGTRVNVRVTNTIRFDPSANGGAGAQGSVLLVVDNRITTTGASVNLAAPFTNYESTFDFTYELTLNAGFHTLETYVIAKAAALPPAQLGVSTNALGASDGTITASIPRS